MRKVARSEQKTTVSHYGYTSRGALFPAESEVLNEPTRWVRRMIRAVRDRLLTPSDVLLELLSASSDVRDMFAPDVAGQWGGLTRYHEWPSALAPNSALECIKRQGRGDDPPWKHEESWAATCDRAQRLKGQESRHKVGGTTPEGAEAGGEGATPGGAALGNPTTLFPLDNGS